MTHTVTPSSMPTDAAVSGETARRRGWGWLLLVPGMLYLLVFFVYPTVQLFLTSLYDPSGSYVTGYTLTWHVSNYWNAIHDTWHQFGRSLRYAGIATDSFRPSCERTRIDAPSDESSPPPACSLTPVPFR